MDWNIYLDSVSWFVCYVKVTKNNSSTGGECWTWLASDEQGAGTRKALWEDDGGPSRSVVPAAGLDGWHSRCTTSGEGSAEMR